MIEETGAQREARQTREHREKYAKLARTLGEDWLAGLVQHLVVRCAGALREGDRHLNTIPLAVWDTLAGVPPRSLGPRCCDKLCGTKFCPHCGKQLRETRADGSLWPYDALRETSSKLPWRNAPGLSLCERVCVLKYTATRLAEDWNSKLPQGTVEVDS